MAHSPVSGGTRVRRPAAESPHSRGSGSAAGASLPAGFRWPHVHWDRIDDPPDIDDLVPLGALVCQCDWSTGFPLEREEHGRLVHRDRLPSLLHHIVQLDLAELAPYDTRTGLLQVFTGRTTDAAGVGIGHVEYQGTGLSARLGGREHGTGFAGGEFRLLGHPQDFDKEFHCGYPWHGLDPTMPRGAQMLVGWVDPGTDSPAYVHVYDDALARGDFSQVTVEFTQQ
ncbi:hypothetical protein [Actinoallomurus iriomotensis]|uniref:Uncharacterized protein n=1 Tax=Actinoallomurus iriomotensis TaxID=478107 RepID=A0A9W6S6L7_9ACTN|nr:hypothetical protein [Actinoallomurus iriomotensis]GLY86667.1 hypothetical protein Airi02_045960 [Actinoallomurus iriomotensis]